MVQLRLLFAGVFLAGLAAGADPDLTEARKLYNSTDFERSIKVLQAMPSKNAAVYDLMGRDYFMQAEYKRATEVMEKAVALEPGNSDYALWLGRAWGRRAETFEPVYRSGTRFQSAAISGEIRSANTMNLEAQSDLFEYYLEAPGFLGGGLDRAEATAAQIGKINAAEGQWAQAKLAEKRKEAGSAEEHLRRAVELAPQQVGKLLELARFLVKQGRFQEAEQSFDHAEKITPNNPRVMFSRAETYVKAHRNLDVAKDLLKRYMNEPLGPDDAPKSEAAKLLKQAQGL